VLSLAAAPCPRHGGVPGPRTGSERVLDVRFVPAARPFSVSPDAPHG
jgi:hypothetical protein